MRRYTVHLIPGIDHGGYTVTVPTLPGLVTEGDTLAEALDALRLYIDDLAAEGEPVPEETVSLSLATVVA